MVTLHVVPQKKSLSETESHSLSPYVILKPPPSAPLHQNPQPQCSRWHQVNNDLLWPPSIIR